MSISILQITIQNKTIIGTNINAFSILIDGNTSTNIIQNNRRPIRIQIIQIDDMNRFIPIQGGK